MVEKEVNKNIRWTTIIFIIIVLVAIIITFTIKNDTTDDNPLKGKYAIDNNISCTDANTEAQRIGREEGITPGSVLDIDCVIECKLQNLTFLEWKCAASKFICYCNPPGTTIVRE
ncbi:hypothetical protein COU61_01265 [Candidatus Pacearchaeota archaeon CG10_big_fil_rev_8_21_14_0_10_35_13]|nr:MAG: hypothetical protein COU61_01265 [Candidatus Pacearchaeota archaeon CG10_big_fil_rev_8_21_14_0_10_35_13]